MPSILLDIDHGLRGYKLSRYIGAVIQNVALSERGKYILKNMNSDRGFVLPSSLIHLTNYLHTEPVILQANKEATIYTLLQFIS